MKPATREWLRCAEEDFDVASALMRRRTRTAANIKVCRSIRVEVRVSLGLPRK